jgi:prolyl-tRNA synthetase
LGESDSVRKTADELYESLQLARLASESVAGGRIEVLYDDREDVRAGEKFADADLIGLPWRIVVSDKTIEQGKFELKNRKTGEVTMVDEKELFTELT